MAPMAAPAPGPGAPAPGGFDGPKGRPKGIGVPGFKLPKKKEKSAGIDLFTKVWPRQKKKRRVKRKTTILKEFGLLRNVMIWIPWWVSCVLERLTSVLSVALQLLLTSLVAAELLGLDVLVRRSTGDLARPLGSARRLAVLAYDSALSLMLALAALLRLLPLPSPEDEFMLILRRLALLQSCQGAFLHCSSVIRWPVPSCDYRVPPLLSLLAYFAQPWASYACFLVLQRPDDHKLGGGLLTDCGVMAASLCLRIAIFGRYGRPRMPREPQPLSHRVRDAMLYCFAMIGLDALLLRNAWIERRRNWKYVFSLVLLILPVPFWRQLLSFFREDVEDTQPKKKVRKGGRPTREDVRADIYGKLRPGVPTPADLPPDAPKKIRERRTQLLHQRGHGEVFAPPQHLPVAGLGAAKEAPPPSSAAAY